MPYQGLLPPEPHPCSSPLLTHTSSGHTQTQLSQPLWSLWVLISPLLPSCWGFSFILGWGVSLFGGIQHSPVNGCSTAGCNFGVLAREDEHISFYSTVLILLNLFLICYRVYCQGSFFLLFILNTLRGRGEAKYISSKFFNNEKILNQKIQLIITL